MSLLVSCEAYQLCPIVLLLHRGCEVHCLIQGLVGVLLDHAQLDPIIKSLTVAGLLSLIILVKVLNRSVRELQLRCGDLLVLREASMIIFGATQVRAA